MWQLNCLWKQVGIVLAATVLSGCAGSPPRQPAGSAGRPFLQAYAVEGIVRELRPEENAVVIQHDSIPGFKPAATTPFTVRNSAEMQGLLPGNPVSFRLIVTGTNALLDQIQVVGTSAPTPP